MGVEVVGFEAAPAPVEAGTEAESALLHDKENGKLDQGPGVTEPIKFGSHGDEPVKGEGNNVSDNFPKDVVDEWPAPKQIHSFYFVKYRSYDDPKIKAKLDQADKEIQRRNQARFQITEGLRAKKSDRAQMLSQLKSLKAEDEQFRMIVDGKRKEMEPLQHALGKLRSTNSANRERGGTLCSSEEELNDLIQSLHYHMQHESIPLAEEKQILREIKQLEATREKVIAGAAMRAKIQDSLGQKEAIQDQVKLIGVDLDGVRKEKQVVMAKIKQLRDDLKGIDSEIDSLMEELKAVSEKRDKAYEGLQALRKQRDEGNAHFYQNRALLNNARELAGKKDIKALEELSHSEVEKFMSLWSSNKAFREDYEKRILPSLDSRQLSRDGRMRNPDEKPLVVLEAPTPSETETVAKAPVKRSKEDSKPPPQHDTLPSQKVQKEANDRATDSGITLERGDKEEKEIIPGLEKHQKGPSLDNEVDAAKLKEMKREEEIAKAKLALERKKKLADKSAAKAAIRAQKEAEKKLKEREKKAKKKAASSATATNEEPTEAADAEVVEVEKTNVNVEPPVPSKTKEQKENTIRHRNKKRGPDSLPRAILKRKKTTNYWIWAAAAAAVLLVLLLVVVGFHYLL
ncbi:proton pump-interactor 1 [Vitis riparia]|uniref:proton pump-interactor 1 n=1 Tax=Vitis riparia TaxID=96939 RepID=UPI00023B2A47|nr:proton pump-interactor 1 [Vitis riparia]XP_034678357.1 proton pump-interactor 1 [Vitis riparia]|eukprot:XP_002285016.2 PREDICTED: proton pump-interactor 1 [Vitis vinifera]